MSEPEVTRICVEALGVVIPLDVRGPDLASAVGQAWQDCRTTSPPDQTAISVAVDGPADADVSGLDIAEVLHRLSPAVTHAAIAARAGELVMLHAAGLADPDTGATAILVAPSGTGKTTAARTLGTHFAYLTDETAGIDRDGTMIPYAKPLSIIRTGHVKDQVAPSELGLRTVERPCHVAGLFIVSRDAQHGAEPAVAPLETIDALAAMAPEASFLGQLDHPLHRLADVVHRVGGAHRVTYSEAHTLEPMVRSLLEKAAR
ncbi:hypothetical protein [Nocardioides sediminis]|uniref:hypothetical protein n=1 Tax=Nocardioides sediminis TaxID=433648 RepID=UPI00131F37EA|nr:hypothetical protein [Nocardioides sediminis]